MKHCWADWYEELTDQEQVSQEDTQKLLHNYSATCLLELGHAGPHQWTNNEDIAITFKDEETTQ